MKEIEIREELHNAILFIEGTLQSIHLSDSELKDVHHTILAIQEAIKLIDELTTI